MKGLSPHLIWLLVFYFTAYASTYSQGWEQTFGNPPTAMGREGIQTSDGGYIFTGDPGGGGTGPTVKTDYLGNAEWTIPHAGTSIQQTFDGGYIIAGGSNNGFLKKIDEMGNLTWTRYYGNTSVQDIASYVEQTLDSGYIVCGALYINGTQGLDYFLVKTDVNGDTLWSRTYGGSGSDWANEVHQTTDGGFVLVGRRNGSGGVIKTDAMGNLEWETNFTPYGDQSIQQTFDGGYIVAGYNLTKLNSSGQEIWVNNISGTLHSVKQTFDGGYVCAGGFGINESFYLLKTDTSGNKEWDKTFYGGPDTETAESVHLTNDGGYILCGYRDFGTGNVSMYVVKTDAYGNTFTNVIDGYVYMDSDSNCVKDSGEVGLANRLVYISPSNIYATTDATGYYSAMVGQGNYNVRQLGLNSAWNLSCPNPPGYYIVNFATSFDTSSHHFGNQAAQDCPMLTVDIGTWALRPCTTSVYTVKYCNNGTINANNVVIEIEFDEDISPTSSTIPWSSQNGNFYQFNIGSVPFNQCGSFQIQALVSCDVIMGSTHCVTANISPDSLCTTIDSTWDRSSIDVVGYCNNDSLACFKLTNTGDPGSGDMQGPSEYRIYQNNMLVYTDNIQLTGGDSTEICWPANGHTIRLETDQRPGHPGNSQPRDHVELCGSPYLTLGQINSVPEDDVDPSIEIHCIEVTGSFDPNDKHVNPVGVKDQHIIDSLDVLEYQINFQNTGTDTAFKVIIKDAISQHLDISTIELGASSHNYTFSIKTSRILQYTFDNILLPDSNTNEPESHGFVRFKIRQKQGNTHGTVIENSAGIFFDFNDPVITNTVFNTVGNLDSAFCYIIASYTYQVTDSSFAATSTSENTSLYFWDFDDGSTSTQQNPTHTYASPGIYNVIHAVSNQCGTDTLVASINVQYTGVRYYDEVKLMVKVQPNPFSTSTIVSITGLTHTSIFDFELFDIVGNRVMEMRGITGDHFQVSRGSLTPGTYFYKLRDDRQKVGIGKLIVL